MRSLDRRAQECVGPRRYDSNLLVFSVAWIMGMLMGLRPLPPAPSGDGPVETPRRSKGGPKMVPENLEAGSEQPSRLEAGGSMGARGPACAGRIKADVCNFLVVDEGFDCEL